MATAINPLQAKRPTTPRRYTSSGTGAAGGPVMGGMVGGTMSRPTAMSYDPVQLHQNYTPPHLNRPGAIQATPPVGNALQNNRQQAAAANQQQSPYDLLSSIFADYQSAQDAAKQGNLQRYDDILEARLQARDRNLDLVNSLGDQQVADTNQRYDDRLASLQADLANRGLGGSSLRMSNTYGNERERSDALRRVQDDITTRRVNADTQLTDQALAFMERRNDTGPDFNQLAQLMQMIGAGGFGQGYDYQGQQTAQQPTDTLAQEVLNARPVASLGGGGGGRAEQQQGSNGNGLLNNRRLLNAVPQDSRRMASNSKRQSTEGRVSDQTLRKMDEIRREQLLDPTVDRNMVMGGAPTGAAIGVPGMPMGGAIPYGQPVGGGGISNYGGYTPRPSYTGLRDTLAGGSQSGDTLAAYRRVQEERRQRDALEAAAARRDAAGAQSSEAILQHYRSMMGLS